MDKFSWNRGWRMEGGEGEWGVGKGREGG